MAEIIEIIEDADPTAALERIRAFANDYPRHRQFLQRLEIKVERSKFGPSKITIRPNQSNTEANARRAWPALRGTDEKMIGDATESGFYPFANGLANLLLESCAVYAPGEGAQSIDQAAGQNMAGFDGAHSNPQQKLLAMPDLSLERSAELFWFLGSFATQRRTARANTTSGEYQLFWIQSDRERMSNLDSFVAAGLIPEGRLLNCYICDESREVGQQGWLVFLPEDRVPSRKPLADFCWIVQSASELFGQRPLSDSRILAAALTPVDGTVTKEPQLLYLASLRFYDEWAFAPRRGQLRSFEVLSLEASVEEVDNLALRIDEAKPRMGYQLQFRQFPSSGRSKKEIERLRRQAHEINERLADLIGFVAERPSLLRFGPDQLPVLADFVRYYPPNVLGHILYGFAHTDAEPSGNHFLYVKPEIQAMADLDPLTWWGRFGNGTIRFWLDPSWARGYAPNSLAQVFVPYGLTLYPALHSFEVDEMDGYLRRTFAQLADDQGTELAIPSKPIYVFDGQGKPGEPLTLSVIDFQGLVPLTAKLGWINANLVLLAELGLEGLVEEMADSARRSRLAERLSKAADAAEREVNREVERIGSSWAKSTNSMLELVTQEANQLIDSSKRFIKEAQELNQRLIQLRRLHSEIRGLVTDVELRADEVEQKEKALKSRCDGLSRRIKATISEAESVRRQWDQQVGDTIARLQATHDRLGRKLDELWRLGD